MATFEICYVRHSRNFAHCWRDFNFPLYSFVKNQGADFNSSRLIIHKKSREMTVMHKECYTTLFPNAEVRKVTGKSHPLKREDIRITRADGSITTRETFFKNYLQYLPEWRKFILAKLAVRPDQRKEYCLVLQPGTRRKILNTDKMEVAAHKISF